MALTSRRPYLIRAMYEWISDNELTPHIIVDATMPGVHAPNSAISDGKVVLNVSMRATRHIELGNESIEFEARFGGVAQTVSVPCEAVLAIYARETNEGLAFASEGDLDEDDGEAIENSPPILSAVDTSTAIDGDDNDEPPSNDPPPKRGHLKVVK